MQTVSNAPVYQRNAAATTIAYHKLDPICDNPCSCVPVYVTFSTNIHQEMFLHPNVPNGFELFD
jgi:hypothetical protein